MDSRADSAYVHHAWCAARLGRQHQVNVTWLANASHQCAARLGRQRQVIMICRANLADRAAISLTVLVIALVVIPWMTQQTPSADRTLLARALT
jgi:hypothetical protein